MGERGRSTIPIDFSWFLAWRTAVAARAPTLSTLSRPSSSGWNRRRRRIRLSRLEFVTGRSIAPVPSARIRRLGPTRAAAARTTPRTSCVSRTRQEGQEGREGQERLEGREGQERLD